MTLKFTWAFLAAAVAYGQPAAQPSFEVASIRQGQDFIMVKPQRSPGRISWTTDLCRLVAYAHNVELSQLKVERCGSIYVLEATHDANATEAQVRSMLLALLTERFKLRARRETSEAEGFALVPGRGGPKIKEDTSPPTPAVPDAGKKASAPAPLENHIFSHLPERGVTRVVGQKVAMSRLADTLRSAVGRLPVWDRTGLTGVYSFEFSYANANAEPETNAPSLAAALQDTLGLRLEKAKGTVETVAIDSFEKPAEN